MDEEIVCCFVLLEGVSYCFALFVYLAASARSEINPVRNDNHGMCP